jgi:hypothetical protein
VTAFPDRDDIELDWVLWQQPPSADSQQPSTPDSPFTEAAPSSPRTAKREPSKIGAQRQPTAADMRQIGKRASQGDLAAFEELKQIHEILYRDIDYNKDQGRASSNLVLMKAAFDEIGQAAGREAKSAMEALRKANIEPGLKSFAPDAFGIAAGMGNVEALNILLDYKSNAILLSSAVFALRAAAARNEPRAVDFVIEIINDLKHKPLWHGASEGLAAAAQAGNQKSREALEKYKNRDK